MKIVEVYRHKGSGYTVYLESYKVGYISVHHLDKDLIPQNEDTSDKMKEFFKKNRLRIITGGIKK